MTESSITVKTNVSLKYRSGRKKAKTTKNEKCIFNLNIFTAIIYVDTYTSTKAVFITVATLLFAQRLSAMTSTFEI